MDIFKSSLQSYLGVDISPLSIKIVEVKKHGNNVALSTYAFSERFSEALPKESAPLDIHRTSDLIKSICQKAHASSNLALASLPTFSVFSSIININHSVNKKDLEAAINWEAKKVIPLPLSDIVLDWQIVDEAPAPIAAAGGHKVLLTGAPKTLIQNYVGVFKNAQLNLLSLETEIFALIRSLLGNDRSASMIVQLGSTTTNIFVVDKSAPVINRSIAVGGISITQAIAANLNMSLSQAEQFKYDLMHNGTEGGKLPAMIIESMSPIINEIKYILEVFGNKDNRRVEKIILTGGGALLPGLTEYLAEMFNLNVIVGDPWFRVAYPFELKPILEKIGPRLAVAIGLAMREFDHK